MSRHASRRWTRIAWRVFAALARFGQDSGFLGHVRSPAPKYRSNPQWRKTLVSTRVCLCFVRELPKSINQFKHSPHFKVIVEANGSPFALSPDSKAKGQRSICRRNGGRRRLPPEDRSATFTDCTFAPTDRIAPGAVTTANRGSFNLTQEGAPDERDQHCQSAASAYDHDSIDRLRLVAAEHILELRQQRRPLLELGRVMGTPSAPQAAHPAKVEPQEAEALAAA